MQLSLQYSPTWRASEAWPKVLAEVQRVLTEVTLKQAAYDLDTTPSYLSNAIGERDRHYLRAEHLLYFVIRDSSTGLVQAIADLAKCDVTRRRELTDAEKVQRYEQALAELGPEIRDLVARKAGLK